MSAPTPTPRTCGEISCDECNARTAALTAERDQLRAELAKERARLDWLEKSDPDAMHWWTVGEPNSIRVDIDAAMRGGAK